MDWVANGSSSPTAAAGVEDRRMSHLVQGVFNACLLPARQAQKD